MVKRFLGDSIDIHAGGVDLTFPHHENEIAQVRCRTLSLTDTHTDTETDRHTQTHKYIVGMITRVGSEAKPLPYLSPCGEVPEARQPGGSCLHAASAKVNILLHLLYEVIVC
jgi:hypothetical protein